MAENQEVPPPDDQSVVGSLPKRHCTLYGKELKEFWERVLREKQGEDVSGKTSEGQKLVGNKQADEPKISDK